MQELSDVFSVFNKLWSSLTWLRSMQSGNTSLQQSRKTSHPVVKRAGTQSPSFHATESQQAVLNAQCPQGHYGSQSPDHHGQSWIIKIMRRKPSTLVEIQHISSSSTEASCKEESSMPFIYFKHLSLSAVQSSPEYN